MLGPGGRWKEGWRWSRKEGRGDDVQCAVCDVQSRAAMEGRVWYCTKQSNDEADRRRGRRWEVICSPVLGATALEGQTRVRRPSGAAPRSWAHRRGRLLRGEHKRGLTVDADGGERSRGRSVGPRSRGNQHSEGHPPGTRATHARTHAPRPHTPVHHPQCNVYTTFPG